MPEIFDNNGPYRAAWREDENGRRFTERVFRVRGATRDQALADDLIPPRGSAFDEANPGIVAVSYGAEPDGGDWWVVTVGYESVFGGGEPVPVAGLLYSRLSTETGTLIREFDIQGNKMQEGGVAVEFRAAKIEVVHYRDTPPPIGIMLGLIGEPADANLTPVNGQALNIPPFQWEDPGQFGTQFSAGQLRYIDSAFEYVRSGLWIARHRLLAAPDHLNHWWENGVRRSAVIFPVADLASLWS